MCCTVGFSYVNVLRYPPNEKIVIAKNQIIPKNIKRLLCKLKDTSFALYISKANIILAYKIILFSF